MTGSVTTAKQASPLTKLVSDRLYIINIIFHVRRTAFQTSKQQQLSALGAEEHTGWRV